ncbi:deoxycytidylate deaminase [Desulfothermobacter acidiphilus]|uniref:deoxycytidylate deaminase n=1 Tax=Desulfothermobacter acidiphilus TaxID=1938353 RepID=UPI003F8B4616
MRPDWDTYFMTLARVVSLRSTCLRRRVGAVLVKDNRILATGYNGAPSGLRHCLDIGCLRQEREIPSGERHELCRGLHAEQNALLQAAVYGVSIAGATLYTTHFPCALCAKMLIQAEIRRVVYLETYPDDFARELFAEAGVRLEPFRGELCFPGRREEDRDEHET